MTAAMELDPSLLPWALVPILLITCAVSYGRLLLNVLMAKDSSKVDDKDLVYKQTLQRAARLRANGFYLTTSAIKNREQFFLGGPNRGGGALDGTNVPAPDPSEALSKLSEMSMGGQMAAMVSQMMMYSFITWVFPGFVLLKLPFPVTEKFRPLLQNGLMVPTLDVTYVTSLSWYFLTMFGTQPFVMLLAAKLNRADLSDVMLQQQMGMGMQQQQPQQFDAKKLLEQEAKVFRAFTNFAQDMTAAKAAAAKLAEKKA
jgi:hypothetical protein